MLDGQGYDISCDLVMKVSVGVQVESKVFRVESNCQVR